MSASEVFAATRRAAACRLLNEQSESAAGCRFGPAISNLREFMAGGMRYVFPGEIGRPARGFCTAQDASPLSAQIVRPSPGELPLVWPHSDGDTRGYALKPLYRSVPDAARHDPQLYAWLALADAMRTGEPRIRALAKAELDKLFTELDHARLG